MSLFQNISYDNFFTNPNKIIDISKNIDFKRSDYMYGFRSQHISFFNKELFNYINLKILNFYYPNVSDMSFSAQTFFQKSLASKNDGWIHNDTGFLVGIIYLNKDGVEGTSLYKKKEEFNIIDTRIKTKYFCNPENFNTEEKERIHQEKLKNNNKFIKTIQYEGEFNRLVCFNASNFHAADVFEHDKERLAIVTSITKIFAQPFPLDGF
tara:strand:+ start:182 stop:808 length:627 start_codon:yes stop_codon:yes gene_type:complete